VEETSAVPAPVSPVARRFQTVLAALLSFGGIAWSVDAFRWVGLVIFPEQFLAGMYAVCLALLFVSFPARRGSVRRGVPWYDVVCALAGLAASAYVAVYFPTLTAEAGAMPIDGLIVSVILSILTLEGVRRTSGYSLLIMVLALVAYVLVGHLVPGQLKTHKVDIASMVIYLGLDTNGLFGLVLEISVTIVVAFVLMGQLLARSGGSGFFNDFALGIMGGFRGGAAKIAVVGSSLFGMISGIAAANALAVGVVTIPLMKKSGIPARLAAAIEACASNGGQLMPPVMGAVAFVMADFLQVPYKDVAIAAILPSVLYYAALFIQCDLEAARYGFSKVDRTLIPPVSKVLLRGWLFIVPFAAIVVAMFSLNWEPEAAAMLASACIIVIGMLFGYGGTRMNLRDVWVSIVDTGTGVCEIIVISAVGGFILGLFQVSGLSFALTAYLVNLGAQNLLLLLVLAAVLNIALGMGLPTLAVYVMLAILVAPALEKVGVQPMAAHMFILYFGMMSLITPPVATAAFVAATIAKTDPMDAGWTAMRFGWTAYIVPCLFVYAPAILFRGSVMEITVMFVTALAGIWFISAAMTGYAMRVMGWPMRGAFILAGALLLMPFQASVVNGWLNAAGVVLGAALFAYEFRSKLRPAAA